MCVLEKKENLKINKLKIEKRPTGCTQENKVDNKVEVIMQNKTNNADKIKSCFLEKTNKWANWQGNRRRGAHQQYRRKWKKYYDCFLAVNLKM